jgi:collagen type IV alpha-3-binding protein
VRVLINVLLQATTEAIPASDVLPAALTRKNIGARIVYIASVNPGGWAPPAAVQFVVFSWSVVRPSRAHRAISKREYPKFLRNISKMALQHFENKPIAL